MPQRFEHFFNTVEGGNEGDRCHYPVRLDTYGCGCQHNCGYCYARSLLAFRGLWNPQLPATADIKKIVRIIATKLRPGQVVRLGGMTDCFQPLEKGRRLTYRTIQILNAKRVHYLIVTKSALVATDPYVDVMDPLLAHIQVSITTSSDELSRRLEPGASLPGERRAAVETLAQRGFDVSVRLSPFIPELISVPWVNSIDCEKVLVEFLRVNAWIEKWLSVAGLPVDLRPYTHFSAGYKHLPLPRKQALLARIQEAGKQVSVCEDVPEHWAWWKDHVNANPDDCCNLNLK